METAVEDRPVTVQIGRDVWKAAKIAATEDDQTLQEFVEAAVYERLERRKKTRK
jgi:hypothetical protein